MEDAVIEIEFFRRFLENPNLISGYRQGNVGFAYKLNSN